MGRAIRSFIRDVSGATAIEYGLIALVIGLGILVGALSLKDSVNASFGDIAYRYLYKTGAPPSQRN